MSTVENEQEYFIYRLVDPVETYKVLYVGMTTDVFRRYIQHLADVNKNTLKGEVLRGLRDKGMVPYMQLIETVFGISEARTKETYWINFYLDLHMPLVNSDLPTYVKTPVTNVRTMKARIIAPIDIKDAIKQYRRDGLPHRIISRKVGLYGIKYKQYQEICRELGLTLDDKEQQS